MAISRTYGDLQNQIADDLVGRTDLLTVTNSTALSQIQQAIQDAIDIWEREFFYFNSLLVDPTTGTSPFNTVKGQQYYGEADYAPIATLASISKLFVMVSGNRYFMVPRTPQYMHDVSVNPDITGQPVDYAYEAEQLNFYPIPDNAYAMGLSATQRLSALVDTGDANAWTQDAFNLIRAQAKLNLAENALHDPLLAQSMTKAIYGDPMQPGRIGYLAMLRGESTRRVGKGRIRPTFF